MKFSISKFDYFIYIHEKKIIEHRFTVSLSIAASNANIIQCNFLNLDT